MAITTMAGLSAAAKIPFFWRRGSVANVVAGDYTSAWVASAAFPTLGVAPGAAAIPTSATAGALAAFANPTGGMKTYLYGAMAGGAITNALPPNHYMLYDRVMHMSGLSGTVTTAQAVNTPALPARAPANGIGVRAFLEWYANTGATVVTATVSYTNQAGTAGRTSVVSLVATQRAATLIPIPYATDDTGVQSVQSVTLSATTGTAGNFGVTLAVPILAHGAGGFCAHPTPLGPLDVTLPIIPDSACLWYVVRATTTSTGVQNGMFTLVQG